MLTIAAPSRRPQKILFTLSNPTSPEKSLVPSRSSSSVHHLLEDTVEDNDFVLDSPRVVEVIGREAELEHIPAELMKSKEGRRLQCLLRPSEAPAGLELLCLSGASQALILMTAQKWGSGGQRRENLQRVY